MRNYIELIEDLSSVSSENELENYIRMVCDNYGLSSYSFFNYVPNGPVTKIDGRPLDWVKHYFSEGYDVSDLIVQYGFATNQNYTWEEAVSNASSISDIQRTIIDGAQQSGLKTGLITPIDINKQSKASVSFYSDHKRQFSEVIKRHRNELVALSYAINGHFQRQIVQDIDKPHLSPREIDCLTWAARGKTNAEIAEVLAMSSSAVNTHLRRAGQKMGVYTKIHAVARAVQLQLIMVYL